LSAKPAITYGLFVGFAASPSVSMACSEPSTAMRYYFDVKTSVGLISDLEGSELPNDKAALDEALMMARELIGTQLIDGKTIDWESCIEVRNVMSLAIGSIDFLEAAGITWPFIAGA
jgi:hypothetical protein